MKYCSHCGNQLLDEAVMCPKCGNMVSQNQTAPSKKTNGKQQALAALSIILGIAVIVITIVIVLSQL